MNFRKPAASLLAMLYTLPLLAGMAHAAAPVSVFLDPEDEARQVRVRPLQDPFAAFGSLKPHNMPLPSLTGIVANRQNVLLLGKALFWDQQTGSDGVACATCHFHAGADRRTRNQLEPGSRHAAPSGQTFEKMASGTPGGVNH